VPSPTPSKTKAGFGEKREHNARHHRIRRRLRNRRRDLRRPPRCLRHL
jgi:hypothetical protein